MGKRLQQIAHRELHSLRGRMIYSVLGMLVVLILLVFWQHSTGLRSRAELIRTVHARSAMEAARTLRQGLLQIYRQQQAIGLAAFSGRMPDDQVSLYLDDLRFRTPALASIMLVTMAGDIIHASPVSGSLPVPSEQPYFQALSPENPHFLSNVYVSSAQEVPKIRIASIYSDLTGQPAGIVVMEFFTWMLEDLTGLQQDGEIEIVLDGAGHVIYSGLGAGIAPTVASNARLQDLVRRHVAGPVKIRLSAGEPVLGYATPVRDTPWTVAYFHPEREALRPITEITRTTLYALLLVVATLGAVLLLILRYSLRPLVRLSAAAKKLGSLDLSFRLPPAEVREFEPLVTSFNRMAQDLQRAHHDLTKANHDLELRVLQRTRQLEEEHQKVLRAERLSTLGLLSSAIAHDLRNPLNSIGLQTHWLKHSLGRTGDQPADQRMLAKLEHIERELRRSDQIIRTLLAFARTGEPERAETEIEPLVRETIAESHLPDAIHVELSLPAPLPPVSVDRAQMQQVLENLLRNAVQAMPDGGTLRIRVEATHDVLRIGVSDTGLGMTDEVQATIFEPLVSTKPTGTGIGLALCKRIVEAHGGHIAVSSRLGEGSTFVLEIPTEPAS